MTSWQNLGIFLKKKILPNWLIPKVPIMNDQHFDKKYHEFLLRFWYLYQAFSQTLATKLRITLIYSILSRIASALLLGKAISLLALTEHGILVHLSISSSRSRNILTIFLLKRKKNWRPWMHTYLKTFREFMKLATASLSLLLCACQEGGRNVKKFGGDRPTWCA